MGYMKNSQIELLGMDITMFEMKNLLDGITDRLDIEEKMIGELKD